jgi:hypothetical protein
MSNGAKRILFSFYFIRASAEIFLALNERANGRPVGMRKEEERLDH